MKSEIEVVELKTLENGGNLKAFVCVQIGGVTIRDFRVIQQEGQRAWVSVPCASWQDENGKRCYKRLMDFPEELKRRIDAAVLAAYRAA